MALSVGVLLCPCVIPCRSAAGGFIVAVWDKDAVTLKLASVDTGATWEAMCENLADTEISFGAQSVHVEGSLRYVFFTWCGPSVSAIKRGKVSLQKNAVYNAFEGVVCEVYITDREELAKDAVAATIAKAVAKSVASVVL